MQGAGHHAMGKYVVVIPRVLGGCSSWALALCSPQNRGPSQPPSPHLTLSPASSSVALQPGGGCSSASAQSSRCCLTCAARVMLMGLG